MAMVGMGGHHKKGDRISGTCCAVHSRVDKKTFIKKVLPKLILNFLTLADAA